MKATDRAFATGFIRALISKDVTPDDLREIIADIEREKPRYWRAVPAATIKSELQDAPHDPEAPLETAIDQLHTALEGSGMELEEQEVRKVASWPAQIAGVGRDVRLPAVGETIVREHAGKEYHVTMLESGFLHDGEEYGSLSAIAKKITGAKACNGYVFFGLTEPRRSPDNDPPVYRPGVAGNACGAGDECGRAGCEECQK